MKIPLNAAQIIHLEAQHKSEDDGHILDRIKAVLLQDKGWTYKHIAQTLLMGLYLNEYLREEKLKPNNGGSRSKLDEQQMEKLIIHLEEHTYPSTDVSYTQQGMHDWLSYHRFSYKKPKGTPAKFNAARQTAFIKKYDELKTALREQ